MREVRNENVIEEIEYINKVLRQKKRGFKKLAFEDYCLDDKDLLKILEHHGYTKIKNKFVRTVDITNSNIEVIEPNRQVIETTELSNIDTTKLNLLLDNLDHLLKLIPKEKCIYRNNIIGVRTLRLDTGLYEELKHRSELKNETISELLNIAIENYLNDFK